MSTRIGYVVRDRVFGSYWKGSVDFGQDLQSAKVYDGNDEVTIVQSWRIIPVRVTEEPGPPIREVVELRGTVDLDGLKFAVQRNGDAYWNQVGWGSLAAANLWDTLCSTVDSVRRLQLVSTIVGVREVPGPTVRTVTEITE